MISRVKLAKFSAKLVANFRRSLEGDFRASFAGKMVRSIFHQNSTANFTIKLHYGGSWVVAAPTNCELKHWNFRGWKVPNSRFALHDLAPPKFTVCAPFLPLIHALCAFFQAALDALSTAPSPPPSQFTVCTSRFARLRSVMLCSLP